jgi:hypothetical protein
MKKNFMKRKAEFPVEIPEAAKQLEFHAHARERQQQQELPAWRMRKIGRKSCCGRSS